MKLVKYAAIVVVAVLTVGCSTVKPYEKEHLADPIMEMTNASDIREQKWMEAREGSTGGTGGSGGGCACK